MIAEHISDLIVAAKALPNSLQRNKIVSHLEDALAHAKVLEISKSQFTYTSQESSTAPAGFDPTRMTSTGGSCICRTGMTVSTCPLHGQGFNRA